MTLAVQIVTLLAGVVIIAGVGYAVYLYNTMLKAKGTEISALQARIAHLEALAAPALLEEMEKMAPALNRYAARTAEMEAKYGELVAAAVGVADTMQNSGVAVGFMEAYLAVNEFVGQESATASFLGEEPSPVLLRLAKLFDGMRPIIEEGLTGKKPELPRFTKFAQDVSTKILAQSTAETPAPPKPRE